MWFLAEPRWLWASADLGRGWRLIEPSLPAGASLSGIAFADGSTGWAGACGADGLVKGILATSDGGRHWSAVQLPH